jgi:hypothetical protein
VDCQRTGCDNWARTPAPGRVHPTLEAGGHTWLGWTGGPANRDNTDISDSEAVHLARLVRELSERLAEQTALTAIWQARARVLGDQLALAAPSEAQQEG